MPDTLPTQLDPVAVERYQHTLACATYEALQVLRIELATRALNGDQICGQLLPLVCAEADGRPESKAAELLRQEWRVESWLHPERRRSAPAWRLAEYDPAADMRITRPITEQPVQQCHPSIAFMQFIDHIPAAVATRRRLVLTEA